MRKMLLWGCLAAATAIVVAAASKALDARWPLWAAWPFAVFAVWAFARAWQPDRKKVRAYTIFAALLLAIALWLL